jgi:membrane-associated protease RseP (regulator of RpoE activity)
MGTRRNAPNCARPIRIDAERAGVNILIFIAALLIVVMIHESGHFLTAKLFDFKATKFFVGFGPTLWSTQRGETEYGVKALPLGGFVKIIGMNPYEEVPARDRDRSYPNKPRWQRAIVLVAGSATHWVVAFVLLVVAAMTIGFPTDKPTTEIAGLTTRIGGAETPAAALDLSPGDRIVAVGGHRTDRWADVSAYIKDHAGETVQFEIEHDGEVVSRSAQLGTAIFSNGDVVAYFAPGEEVRALRDGETTGGFLGISPRPEYQKEDFVGALGQGAKITWEFTAASFVGIGNVFKQVFDGSLWNALTEEGPRAIDESPCGIVCATQIAGRSEPFYLVNLIVGFTIFVGLMNLLPLPPLDGGHLAVLGYEGVTGRTVDLRKLIPVAAAVISFFVALFLAVLYLDLARPIELPF